METMAHHTVRVAIYTRAGWISGTIHVAPDRSLLEEMNEGGSFFRLTDVSLPLEDSTREFFAMHSNAAVMVLPLDSRDQYAGGKAPERTVQREIVALLAEGTLLCKIDVPEGSRVSDYLLGQSGFFPIRESHMPMMETPPGLIEPIPIAFLNVSRIIGVTEASPMQADMQPGLEDDTDGIFSEA